MPANAGVYRAGNNPGGSPMFQGANAEAFGAGVGRGIEGIADAVEARQKLEKRQERETEATTAGVGMAGVMGETTTDVQDARDSAAAGAGGHTASVTARLDQRLETFLGGIKDERVRNAYRERAAEYRARVIGEEDGWERGQAVEYRVLNIDKQGTELANLQAAKPTADGLADSLGAISTTIGMLDLPGNTKTKVTREQQRKVAVAWGNAMQTTDHAGLLKVLEAGTLSPYLEPEDIDRLRSGAIVEGRRIDAANKAVQAQGEAQAREQLRLFNARISAGDQPSDAEFEANRKLAETWKLPVEEFNLGVSQSRVLINRETRDWTPQQFATTINELRAKGDKRSPDENIKLGQLEQIQGARVAEFNNDPQGRAANIGNPAPALDLAAPTRQSIAARVTWAQGYARANGMVNPPYLSALEMKPLRDRAAQGPAGRLEVAQQLRATFGAGVGSRIVQQMAPNDRGLLLAVGLPGTTSNIYTRGLEALQRNKGLSDGVQEQEIFREVAPAIPQALRGPVFEAARAIAAGSVDQANGDKFDEDSYRTALHLAMGATSSGGGLQGGIGYWQDAPIWLPPGVGQAELQRRVSRASPAQLVDASAYQSAPHYWNNGKLGRALTATEVRSMEFETVRPGVYRVRGKIGGYLVDAKGRPWELDVGKLK